MKLKKTHDHDLPLPHYGSAEAAGADICSAETYTLEPLGRHAFATGWQVAEMPLGFEIQVRPRSGLAAKFGITVLNSPGTIDSDYRGEIKVLLINLSNETHTIQEGDRIAQLVFAHSRRPVYEQTTMFTETARGAGGFGSTGR